MYLKTLTLRGFKSFAEKTTFEFEPGVTAVVGPNGSGKSNVVDALAWVMGEQGVKTLRGGKMEDVIFAGTPQKSPLGRAEVTLTIDNSDGALPIEYSEVTIRRRMFRNGGSEYAINGESCRLLDVQELLSDSGLGRQMHVIVGQGQLDTILRATPEDRRGFVEEAAGILKHRRRKERTERKLEAMEANLTRVNDLAGELRRQLKPLGRQAEIARQAQSIQSGLRDTKARLLADDLVRITTQLAELETQRDSIRSSRALEQSRAEDLSVQIKALEDASVSEDLEQARTVTFRLRQLQDRFRSLERLAAQRVALLSERGDEPTYAPENTEAQALASTQELQALHGREHELATAAEAADAQLIDASNALRAIDEALREQSALISAHELKHTALENAVAGHQHTVQMLQQDVERQQELLAAADARVAEAEGELQKVEDILVDGGADDTDREQAFADAQAALKAVEDERGERREHLQALERERAAVSARATALDQALANGSAPVDTTDLDGVSDELTNLVTVQSGFEAAIAAVLGDDANGYAATSLATAGAAAQYVREHGNGRATFIVDSDVAVTRPQTTPVGATWAPDVVKAPAGLVSLLASTFIVDDLDAALDAVANVPGCTFVTLLGDIARAGAVTGGPHDESRLEIAAARDDAHERAVALESRLRELRHQEAQVSAHVDAAAKTVDELRRTMRDAEAQTTARQAARARAAAQCDAARAERARLHDNLEAMTTRLDAAERTLADAETQLTAFTTVVEPTLDDAPDRESAVAALDAARTAQVSARVELETVRERAKAVRERVEALTAQAQREREANQRAARALAVRSVQREQAQHILDAVPPILKVVDQSVSEAVVAEERIAADRERQHGELQSARQRFAEMQRQLDAVTASAQALDMRLHEVGLEQDNITERARIELALEPDVLVNEYGPQLPVPQAEISTSSDSTDSETAGESMETVPFNRDAFERQRVTLERQLSKLGAINPLALQEFAALEQRHAFLTEQLADLRQTRANLQALIADLDSSMEGIFSEAFADTQRAFDDIFPILFPGGVGKISLTDPAALLTTGIEISIKPAGKNINRLSLLSGGERSLAAIALLVAIFKARPSPFYVMDEVEAALDDANLGRLLAIFTELRAHAQLIVVTHQKRTMEIADALYGVSMRRNGITTVVGQRLQHEEEAV